MKIVSILADSLVDDFDVVELLQFLVEQSAVIFDATAAGIVVVNSAGDLEAIASTSERSEFIGLMQLRAGEGPCVQAIATGKVVSVSNLRDVATRWPKFAADARESGFASAHAIPMRLREDVIGSLNLFSDRVGDLNPLDAAAARTLADIATISILQQRVRDVSLRAQEQLQRALASRVIIEQAKGVISQSRSIDVDAAFDLLRRTARSTQKTLSSTAEEVVSGRLII